MPAGDSVDYSLRSELPQYSDQGHDLGSNPVGAPRWLRVYTFLSRDLRLEMKAQTPMPSDVELGLYTFVVWVSDPASCKIGRVDVTVQVTE
ncbi:MAG: hypothetical protein RJA70_519 [Pseudomonadota bacterium]|jgi:hypothetical protein